MGIRGKGYIILNERGNGAWLINGGLYGASLKLVLMGSFVMFASMFLGPFMEGVFLVAALGFVAAGLFLINGNKIACFLIIFMTLAILKKYIVPKFLDRLEKLKLLDKMYSLLSVNKGAKELCLCNIEPKCFP